ncbi:MAG TPA: hypothetical protein QGF58_00665 [Myxococcota bacterium]|nr:hypothetical protein [Myxococcota bacterium]
MGLIALLSCGPKDGLEALPEHSAVVAFEMNVGETGRPSCLWALEPDGDRCSTTGDPVELTKSQAAMVDTLVSTPESWGEPASKCFVPWHGFVFYAEDGTVTQQVSVSLICEGVRADPELAAMPRRETQQGLSPGARILWLQLCEELGMGRCQLEP